MNTQAITPMMSVEVELELLTTLMRLAKAVGTVKHAV